MLDIAFVNTVLVFINDEWFWFFPTLIVVLGGVFGSFLTCMLYRVPRRLSLLSPPSYCPSCSKALKALDLIPILSYLVYKGRCRYCKAEVSTRYLLIEVLTISIFALTYILIGPQIALLPALMLVVCLLFSVCLLVESGQVAYKVLLFSIIVASLLVLSLR